MVGSPDWTVVTPVQTPEYAQIGASTATYTDVEPAQTPGYVPVAPGVAPSYTDVAPTQAPNWSTTTT